MKKAALVLSICVAAALWISESEPVEPSVKNTKHSAKPLDHGVSQGSAQKVAMAKSARIRPVSDPALDELRRRLDEGLDPDSVENGYYLLTAAINEGSLEKVRLLLERGARVTPLKALSSVRADDDWLPINAAALKGDPEIFKLLLDHGNDADFSSRFKIGGDDVEHDRPLLIFATNSGSVEILEMLVERAGGLEAARKLWPDGRPEYAACAHGYTEVFDWFKSQGATFDAADLLSGAALYGRPEMIDYLVSQGLSPSKDMLVDAKFKNSFLESGNPDILQRYLQWGGKVDLADESTQTLLARRISTDMLEYLAGQEGGGKLLESENFKLLLMSNIDDRDAFNWMLDKGMVKFDVPGEWNAAFSGKPVTVLELALANGLNVKADDDNGDRLLQWAVAHGNSEAVQFLIGKGAELDHQDAQGTTALAEAAMRGNAELVLQLLEAGANPMILEYNGKSALDRAKEAGNPLLIDKLRELGVPEGRGL
ncbi:MAG: hypothetical protein RL095_2079 [Verrucomicrobiota bacterium]|jgi:ankyrin repeat protein